MYRTRTRFSWPIIIFLVFFSAQNAHGAPLRVALLSPDTSNFWTMVTGFAQAVAEDLDIDLTVHTDSSKNRFSYRQLLSGVLEQPDRPDYVMFMAKEMVTRDMLAMAGEAGVGVFTFNTDIPEDESEAVGLPRQHMPHWIGHIAPDNRSAGTQLANFLLEEARDRSHDPGKDRWNLLALSGTRDSSAAKDRDLGLEDALQNKALRLNQLVYANWSEAEAYDKTRRLLRRHQDSDIVWSASDGMALGAIDAVLASGRIPGIDVFVGGMDWEVEALDAIRDGTLSASLGRHFMGGGIALLLLHDYHAGHDFDPGGSKSLTYRFELVTSDNFAQVERALSPETWQSADFRRLSRVYNPDIRDTRLTANDLMDRFMDALR